MDVLEALTSLGGVATTRQLVRLSSARQLRAAVAAGAVVRVGRGRFRTKAADKALKRAVELRGMASHLSAAQIHGWEMPYTPSIPWVSVPRERQVPKERRAIVVWADLSDECGFVTGKLRTVVDCGRRCEFVVAKDAFQRDCWRYTSLTADGWTVLRFTWWQVMEQPDWVREVIERIVARTALGANAA